MTDQDQPKEGEQQAIKITKIDQAIHDVPTVFVDGAHGAAVSGNIVRLNFFQDRLRSVMKRDEEDPIHRTVCLRLVMTTEVLLRVYDWLGPTVERIKGTMPEQSETDAAAPTE